jgi:5'-nucleotidase
MSLVTGPADADQGTGKPKWETPMQRGAELVRKLIRVGWPEGVVLNVNFPDCEPDAVKGPWQPRKANARFCPLSLIW